MVISAIDEFLTVNDDDDDDDDNDVCEYVVKQLVDLLA